MNKPLSILGKKMDNFQTDVSGEFKEKLALLEEKEMQREA